MTGQESYLTDIQQQKEYQLLLRDFSDKAAHGLLTLLVTINLGAFLTIFEWLEKHHWLLILFAISTISALLARMGFYYIYRNEVTMFEYSTDEEKLGRLGIASYWWWVFTEYLAWISLVSFIVGVSLLTLFFIYD